MKDCLSTAVLIVIRLNVCKIDREMMKKVGKMVSEVLASVVYYRCEDGLESCIGLWNLQKN